MLAHSQEEEVARDFLKSGEADVAIVVCDATCLERNLILALQVMEICPKVILCVNLMDEAEKRGIKIDLSLISERLGVPVVGVTARKKATLRVLADALDDVLDDVPNGASENVAGDAADKERDDDAKEDDDSAVAQLVKIAEKVCDGAVSYSKKHDSRDRRLDKIFTGRVWAYPIMLLMLAVILWITIVGANYPSELIASGFAGLQVKLTAIFESAGAPVWLHDMLVLGVYRVLSWVVSVMLPPMAIFFPLFTILDDAGLRPSNADTLDRPFPACGACGKQALTTCMGFGCNAVGVMGCRIIDSPRERLLAILTNNFVPCNGRFSALIALITMFFASAVSSGGMGQSATAALFLTLPPYRCPQFGKVIVRSVLDRTLFVLARAAAAAAPAGLIVWVLSNAVVGEVSMLERMVCMLEPMGRFMGLDGAILTAFILGLPANEIVIPIIIMIYTSQGSLTELCSLAEMQHLFTENG